MESEHCDQGCGEGKLECSLRVNSGIDSMDTNTKSDLESKIIEKDIEINKLTKLAAKYERLLEKTNKYNEDLRNELSKLSGELHKYRNQCLGKKEAQAQVTEEDIEKAYSDKPMPEWSTVSGLSSGKLSIADSLKAAAEEELQKQVQNNEYCHQSGLDSQRSEAASKYVFDEASGLYYHSATGYYWDPNFGLFYDYTSGTYYQYNESSGEYEVYSQVPTTGQSQVLSNNGDNINKKSSKSGKSCDKSGKRKLKRKMKSSSVSHTNCTSHTKIQEAMTVITNKVLDDNSEMKNVKQVEDMNPGAISDKGCGEDKATADGICDSGSESSGSLATGESELVSDAESGEVMSDSSSSDVEILGMEASPVLYNSKTEIAENHPPCIRVIVQSSEHLKCGSLYIITCSGGSVGREKNRDHTIEINDINVSKIHAEILYNYEKQCYTIMDKGSQNGTSLNGMRLTQGKSENDKYVLHHDDLLQIGSTSFLLHIHKGNETCDSCEPGQVQAKLMALNPIKNDYVIMSQEQKSRQRKKELKNIKKKYGLQNSHFENPGAVVTNPDFCDKSYLRRKFIGSESEVVTHNAAPASVQSPISAMNKGHKLLAKMGWKEGEGLGKTSSGIAEPVNVELRVNQTAGFGSKMDVSLSLDNVQHSGKAKRWVQAKQRYQKLDKDNRGTQSSFSGHVSAVKSQTHNNLHPVIAYESNKRDSFVPGNSNKELDDNFLPQSDNGSLNLSEESVIEPPVLNSLKTIEKAPKTLKAHAQYKPTVSWIRGDTEQIGLFPPNNSSTGDLDQS